MSKQETTKTYQDSTGDVMTMQEIKARFPSEWVLIEDPETNEYLEVLCGKVLWHTRDRDELDRKLLELGPHHSAVLYIGEMHGEVAINL
ncbi:MAG TPA: hypothetical protein VFA07_01710 [Chthonomonadaceae bacterium]|nr:hypothetical protein [Chthonomonadaceae bacterium]